MNTEQRNLDILRHEWTALYYHLITEIDGWIRTKDAFDNIITTCKYMLPWEIDLVDYHTRSFEHYLNRLVLRT